MFDRILFATKEIESAHPALDYVRDLAYRDGAEVLVLHVGEVAEDQQALADKLAPDAGDVRDAAARAKRVASHRTAERIVGELVDAGITARTVACSGRVAAEILAAAKAYDVDLIVLGTAGRSRLTAVLTGSVVDEVVRKTTRPVFVVPMPQPAET